MTNNSKNKIRWTERLIAPQTLYHLNKMSGSGKGDPATIFCGGLPWDVQENQLLEYFQTFGNVVNVDLKKNPDTGRSRGFGFITYDSSDTAKDVEEKFKIS